jgi:hypothetical protein
MGKSAGKIQRREFNMPRQEKPSTAAEYQKKYNEEFFNKMGNLPGVTKNKMNLEDMKNDNPRLQRRGAVPKMAPKKAESIKTNLPSERVKSNTPQMSMAQVGKSMSKSGPRKNLRETVASVKGKLQKAYSKVVGKKKG